MEIQKSVDGKTATLKLIGRVDTTTAPEFEKEIDGIEADITDVILDLNELTYTSSAGLRVLLKAQKMMNARGSMKLINVNDDIKEIFDVTGFSDILTIE